MTSYSLPCLFLLLAISCNALSNRDMQDFLKLERELVQNFRAYANELQGRIELLEGAIDEYNEEMERSKLDPELYLSNPINSFKLIRHMHQDWVYWQLYMDQEVGAQQIANVERLLSRTPRRSAIKESVQALQNIVKFFDFTPTDLANRKLMDPMHLSTLDCYHLGEELYKQGSFHEAARWLEAATANYTTTDYQDVYDMLDVPKWKMHELHSKVLLNLNMRDEAFEALDRALDLDPYNAHLLQKMGQMELILIRDDKTSIPAPAVQTTDLQLLCRGIYTSNSEQFCEYSHLNEPYYMLGPFRAEELLVDPYALLYHDVIQHNEILHIQNAFERCPKASQFEAPGIVKGCSISERYSSITKRVESRILDITGLNEPMFGLHVFQYGLQDTLKIFELFKKSAKFDDFNFDNVEATVIVFLNDVSVGGSIIIPNRNMAVPQRRGSALVTFNEGDFEHIICPNVVGSGYVLVKFLHVE